MLDQAFSDLVKEFGKPITLNEETKTRKAIISSQTVNEDYDDRVLHTDFSINRGDIIKWNNSDWIVVSEVAAKRNFEYKATIRPCEHFIGVITTEEEIVSYDEMNRPITEVTETTTNVPCYIDWQRLSINGTQLQITDTELDIVIQDNATTSTIAINDEFDLIDKRYAVQNINKFKTGLLRLRSSIVA